MGVSSRHTTRGRVLITRCSACSTEFRVTEPQLAARNGWVRCGKCMAVFDARRALLAPAAGVASTPALRASSPETGNSASGDQPSNAPLPNLDISAGSGIDLLASSALEPEYDAPLRSLASRDATPEPDPVDGETPGTAVQAATDPAPQAESHPDSIADDRDAPEAVTASGMTRDEAPAPDAQPVPPSSAIPDSEAPPDSGIENAPAAPVESVPGPATVIAQDAEPERAAASMPNEPLPAPGADNPLLLDFGQKPRKRRTALWIGGSVALLATLGAQAAFQYRGTIALLVPETKPYLEEFCASVGCELPLPRRAELLSIETSDLQGHPNNPGVMVLAATLRNRAPFPQSFPALELTLTDDRDQPLARRVLQPADYLGQSALRPEGRVFAPSSEQPIRVFMEASALKATSYRLYLFHP